MPRAASSARDRDARHLLPSEQGAFERSRRRRPKGPATAKADQQSRCALKLEIVHSARYRYTGPIAETFMEVRLQPMDGRGQRFLDFQLELRHGVGAGSYVDGYGNQG